MKKKKPFLTVSRSTPLGVPFSGSPVRNATRVEQFGKKKGRK